MQAMKAVLILAAVLLLSHQCVDARTCGFVAGRRLMAADKTKSTKDTAVVEKTTKPSAKDQSKKDGSAVTPDKKSGQEPKEIQATMQETPPVKTQDTPNPDQTCYLQCNDAQKKCNDDCSDNGHEQKCYMDCSTTQQACIQSCPGANNIATAKQPQSQQVQQQEQPAQGADKKAAGQNVQQQVDQKAEQPMAGDAQKAVKSQEPQANVGNEETNKAVKIPPGVVEATIQAVKRVTVPM